MTHSVEHNEVYSTHSITENISADKLWFIMLSFLHGALKMPPTSSYNHKKTLNRYRQHASKEEKKEI